MKRIIIFLLSFILALNTGAAVLSEEQDLACIENASLIYSDVSGDANYIEMQTVGGQSCITILGADKVIALRADGDKVSYATENTALKIIYYDNSADFLRVKWKANGADGAVTRTRTIHKSGSGEFREAVVLINNGRYNGEMDYCADILIDAYDTDLAGSKEYISKIELINLDTIGANEVNGRKERLLYASSAKILEKLGLLLEGEADAAASAADIADGFERITGMTCRLNGTNMQAVITSWLTALGYAVNGTLLNKAINAGIIRQVNYKASWFGRDSYEMQNFGIGSVEYQAEQTVFYDDLAGLMYNLLFMRANGDTVPFLVRLAEKDADFKDRLLSLNDTALSNAYYSCKGIEISEKTVTDNLTGREMTYLYMKGGNVNAAYVNEFTCTDGENYVLCAAYDKRLSLGVPVIYNTATKQTTMLSEIRNTVCFAMLMSKQNIAYWTEGASLYSYDILTKKKRVVFTEPDNCILQEIPTITNDGEYITVFCGKEISYQPNTIYRIKTSDGSYEVIIDEEWTASHFGAAQNPFLGHVVINPENEKIINFLHGGPLNVDDRLWLYDNGEIYQPYIQSKKQNGAYGEHITHAFWSHNGKRLYFLRPPASSFTVENGITYIDFEGGGGVHTLNGDYSYIHTSVDENDELFVSDTQIVYDGGVYRSQIVLYSDVKKYGAPIAYVPVWNVHPCHPHPTFTADGRKVIFNLSDNTGSNCMVAVMGIDDVFDDDSSLKNSEIAWALPSAAAGMIQLCADDNRTVRFHDRDCTNVGTRLSIDVFGNYIPAGQSRVTALISYFDNGTDTISLYYNTNSDSEYDAQKNKKCISRQKTNSQEWTTWIAELEDASFRSANADGSDFYIQSSGETPLYIDKVAAISGSCGGLECFEAVIADDAVYIPVINKDAETVRLWALAADYAKPEYTIEEFDVAGGDLEIKSIEASGFEKYFLWKNNMKPVKRRAVN